MKFQDWANIFTSFFLGFNMPQKWAGSYIQDIWSPDKPSGIVSPKAPKADR
jgi:hypothetical protein